MADLKREEELAHALISIIRDMAARRIEDCIPELAMWIEEVRDSALEEVEFKRSENHRLLNKEVAKNTRLREALNRYEHPASRLDAGPAALVWLEQLLSSVTAYSDKTVLDAAREFVARFRPPPEGEQGECAESAPESGTITAAQVHERRIARGACVACGAPAGEACLTWCAIAAVGWRARSEPPKAPQKALEVIDVPPPSDSKG